MTRGRWKSAAWGALAISVTGWTIAMVSTSRAPGKSVDPVPTYSAQSAWTLHLLETGRFGEATARAQILVDQEPNAAASYQIRGTLALYTGNVTRARADFQTAIDHDPDNAASHYALALCALFGKNLDEAQAQLVTAAKAPDISKTQKADIDSTRAYIRLLRGDLADAQALMDQSPDANDPLRREVKAMIAAHKQSEYAPDLLAEFLKTPNDVPCVREDAGIRARFESDLAMVEPSITEPGLQRMYAAEMTEQIGASRAQSKPAAAVSGNVTIGAPTTGGMQPAIVTFYVDDQMAAMVNVPPYAFSWNTSQTANGLHRIRVDAADSNGQIIATQTRTVPVANQNQGDKRALDPSSVRGALTSVEYADAENRLWNLLQLRPARKVAEWTLAQIALAHHNQEAANAHLINAAALDLDYKNGRHTARALYAGTAPSLARVASSRPDELWLGNPMKKEVALTFDDGPNPVKCPLLLDIMDKLHAPATFFVVGYRAAESPDIIRRMAKRGDDVENHTYTHPNMTQVLPEVAESEILRNNVIIHTLTGREPRFFRPPGGDGNPNVAKLSQMYGLAVTMWTVDVLKSEEAGSPKQVTDYVLRHLHPGAIILMHNGAQATMDSLPTLVPALRARGYKLVTMTQLVNDGPVLKPTTPHPAATKASVKLANHFAQQGV